MKRQPSATPVMSDPRSYRRSALVAASVVILSTGCTQSTDLGRAPNEARADAIRVALRSASTDSSGESAAPVATGVGWATLRGRFVLDGTAPQLKPKTGVNKDTAVCAPGGQAPLDPVLLVDGNGGIANVAIYLRAAARVHESALGPLESALFDQRACIFLTHVFAVRVGTPVQLKNSDPVGHNTNISGKNSFNQSIPANELIVYTPRKEESVPQEVRCSIHPWMLSYMMPRNNGYFAVTAADGSFEIANLPAGEELEFQVWHESAAGRGGAIVLQGPQAESLNWSNRGRFKIQLEQDQPRDLGELKIPVSGFNI